MTLVVCLLFCGCRSSSSDGKVYSNYMNGPSFNNYSPIINSAIDSINQAADNYQMQQIRAEQMRQSMQIWNMQHPIKN